MLYGKHEFDFIYMHIPPVYTFLMAFNTADLLAKNQVHSIRNVKDEHSTVACS